MQIRYLQVTMIVVSALLLAACGDGDGSQSGTTAVTESDVVRNYADVLHANYADATREAEELRTAIDAFVASPTQASFDAAKQAWRDGRPVYQQSEIGRFYEGPIDDAVDGPEGRINAWPLDESYIDYVAGNPTSGIVNHPETVPAITKETLAAANEAGGETNIATGWHAIEFLLWGQDFASDGPGARPFTDYVVGAGGTAGNQDRRGAYLRAVADLLVDDLASVRDEWAPDRAGNFRTAFLAADPKESLGRILTGLGTLSGGELAGERMSVAFETRDQEDEHSCFSDNTHDDLYFDEVGIQNAYLGRYGTIDGPGIDELLHQRDPELDAKLKSDLENGVARMNAIPEPFDHAILGSDEDAGRQAISTAIDALFEQSDSIAAAAAALGVEFSNTL